MRLIVETVWVTHLWTEAVSSCACLVSCIWVRHYLCHLMYVPFYELKFNVSVISEKIFSCLCRLLTFLLSFVVSLLLATLSPLNERGNSQKQENCTRRGRTPAQNFQRWWIRISRVSTEFRLNIIMLHFAPSSPNFLCEREIKTFFCKE